MKTAHALALHDDCLRLAGLEGIGAQPLHEVVAERCELSGGEDVQAGRVGHHMGRYASSNSPVTFAKSNLLRA
jgi:hypothetical protein